MHIIISGEVALQLIVAVAFRMKLALEKNPEFSAAVVPHETSGSSGLGTPELVVFGVGQMRDLVEPKKKISESFDPISPWGKMRPVDRLVNCGIFWTFFWSRGI